METCKSLRISSLLIFFLLSISGFAQTKIVEVSHYLFPQFTKGLVLMKSGIRNEASLNYNSITEEMIFDNRGTKLAMSQLNLVDTVFIQGRKFILFGGKFVELVYHSKYELYVQHKCSIKDPGKPSGYGGTSQTSATTTYSSYVTGGQFYEMKLPDGLETKLYVEYWLKKDGVPIKFINIRQLAKLFDDKAALFKDYVKKHAVKYTDQESIVALIKYMESI